LLFTGFDVNRIDNGGNFQLSYTFDVSPNADFVAGDFKIENAKGWGVKWSAHLSEVEHETPDGEKVVVPHCDGAYVSEVYDEACFAELIPSGITLE
jgi:hypothetical protein